MKSPSVTLILIRFVVISGFKCEGNTVDAEALSCWVWSIIKHVAKVGIALCDPDTETQKSQTFVHFFFFYFNLCFIAQTTSITAKLNETLASFGS